jgi:uncharacterized membrane protein
MKKIQELQKQGRYRSPSIFSRASNISSEHNYIEEDNVQEVIVKKEKFRIAGMLRQLWSIQCLIITLFTLGILCTGILIWLVVSRKQQFLKI